MQVDRDVVSDRALRPNLVVVLSPSFQLFVSVRKRHEPVGVQALHSEPAIESLDEAVVRRLSGAREVQRYFVCKSCKVRNPSDCRFSVNSLGDTVS